jgi:hypothetical protein
MVTEALRFVRFPAPFRARGPAPSAPWPWVVRIAVVASVLATVASDIAAGAAAGHVLTLGLVAAAVAVIRVRAVGHLGGLWRWVSAGLIAQPLLHDATDLVADAMRSTDSGHFGPATTVLSALVQTVVAGAVVAAVSLVERALALALAEVAACHLVLGMAPFDGARPPAGGVHVPPRDERRFLLGRMGASPIARRGPPAAALGR